MRTSVFLTTAALVGASLTFGLAGPAVAQTSEEVHRLNTEGMKAFSAGEFEKAATLFEKAYSLKPDRNLRKNEAIAWFKADKCDRAIGAANVYLMDKEAPEKDALQMRSVVANCKVKSAREAMESGGLGLAERLLDDAEAAKPDSYALDQVMLARVELAKKRKEEDEARAQRKTERKEKEEAAAVDSPWTTWGWVGVGTGGALVLAGVVYHAFVLFSTVPEIRQIEQDGGNRDRFDSLSDQLLMARWLVPTLYATGLAASGVGVYLLVAPPSDNGEAQSRIGTVGIGVSGSF